MTVATTGGNPAIPTGLEDIRPEDIRMPRLKIVHDQGHFKDPLTGETFDKLVCVILGIVKQRVMWDKDVLDDDVPQCKSHDFEYGVPNIDDELPGRLRFPWGRSVFSQTDFAPDENGRIILPCAKCNFKNWQGKSGDRTPPPCSEQFTMPMLYNTEGDPDADAWATGILTLQKTGLKPATNYMSAFVQRKQPMFNVFTEITLTQQSRGTVTYSVPRFAQLGPTPPEDRISWGQQYQEIRTFLRSGGSLADLGTEEEYEASDNTNTPAPTAPAAAQAFPAAAAPVASAPVQQEASASPVETSAPPAPTAEAPPQAAPSAATDEDDDLPF